ncbi:MAG TPA: hypothetical protein VGB73_20885 [Pyrinomonadaceae bacterium]|jgi:polyferredoxin
MSDLIFTASVCLALAACAIAPIFVLINSIRAYRQTATGRGRKVLKAVLALLIWVLLSFGLFFMTFVYVYANAHRPNLNEPPALSSALTYLGLTVVYALAGFGLAYWMRRGAQADIPKLP